ncbi:MAG: LacI family DNA-binding transcriptional regulator [Victivallales bacterium]|nr:LacI family DNA-binding transcriptional regulator [Victivallales bacterium]
MTLKEIAEGAGVSIRTVRRVLSDEPHVRPDKAKRVRALLKSSPYVPNLLARGLRSKRTGIVGVIAGGLGIEVFTKKLSALQFEAEKRGISTMLALTAGSSERELKFCAEYARFCDGIVFLNSPSPSSLALLREAGTLYVVADGMGPESNVVRIDRSSGIDQAFREIGDLYERFVFLGGDISATEARRAAFDKNTKNVSAENKMRIICENGEFMDGFNAYSKLSSLRRSLVFCYNDRIAAGLLRALRENGLDNPELFGIVGFDNDNFTEYTHKRISTITQSVDELAAKTLDMLDGFMNDKAINITPSAMTRFINRETTLGE